MSNKKRSSFASFICAVYIITLVAFIISVAFDISKGKEAAEKRFRKLTNETSESLKESNPRSEGFYNSFLNSLGNVSDLAGVQVKDAQGLILSYPADLGEEGIHFSGWLTEPFTKSTKLNALNGQEVTLTAAIYLLKPLNLYKKIRLSFIVVLAATLTCLLYLIYTSLYGNSKEKEDEQEQEEEILEAEEEDETESPKEADSSPSPAVEIPQPAAIQQQPAVIVNVNAVPGGGVTTETIRSDNSGSAPDRENEDNEVHGFGNYELTQEEYDGLLADETDDKEDGDFDLDEEEGLELEAENERDATIVDNPEEQKELLDLDTDVAEDDDELFDNADEDDDFLIEDEPSFVPGDGFDEEDEKTLATNEKTLSDESKDVLKAETEAIPAEDEDEGILASEDNDLSEGNEELQASEEKTLSAEDEAIQDSEENSPSKSNEQTLPSHEKTNDTTKNIPASTDSDSDDDLFDDIEDGDDNIIAAENDDDFFLTDEEKPSEEKELKELDSIENEASDPLSQDQQDDSSSQEENKEWIPKEIPEIDDDIFEAEDDDLDIELEDEDETFAEETSIDDSQDRSDAHNDNTLPEARETVVEEVDGDDEEEDRLDDSNLEDHQEEESSADVADEFLPDDESLFDDDELQDKDDDANLVSNDGSGEQIKTDTAESVPETDDKIEVEAEETEPEPVREPEPEIEAEPDQKPETEPISESESETTDETIIEPEAETEPELEAEPDPNDEPVIDETAETETADREESAPVIESTPEPAVDTEVEAEPVIEEETAPEDVQETKTEADMETAAETEPEETEPVIEGEVAQIAEVPQETSAAPVTKEEVAPKPTKPSGLYSDLTGFGWEPYMVHRVDNEILRCTKTNMDISVISAKIEDLDWTSDEGKEVCKCVSETFNSPDLIFEKGFDGFTVALPDTNINDAIATAEDLYSAIDEILAKYDNNSAIGIGISARSLRMISGERLANEAEVALNHAMEDETSPIVAFKVDPQKYRNFLAAQAEQEATHL